MDRLSLPVRWVVLAFLWGAGACESETGSIRDASSNTRVAEAPPGWSVREAVRVGSEDGANGNGITFTLVTGIELDRAGNLYVLDATATQLHVFAQNGRHVRTIGRQGRGPGEFRRPTGLVMTPDGRVWVADAGNARYTVFNSDGTLAATYRKGVRRGFMARWGAVAADDGMVYEPYPATLSTANPTDGVYLGLAIDDDVTTPVDTVKRVAASSPPVWPVRASTATGGLVEAGMVLVPFAPEMRDFLDSRRGYWTARTDEFRFVRQSAEGDTTLIVARDAGPPRPVTVVDVEDAVQQLRDRFGDGLQVERDRVPSTMPYWSTFFVDDAGRLWVQRFGNFYADRTTRPATWEIYNSQGEFLGSLEVSIASNPLPVVRSNRLAGVIRDELGVNYVAVYDLGIRDQ